MYFNIHIDLNKKLFRSLHHCSFNELGQKGAAALVPSFSSLTCLQALDMWWVEWGVYC